MEIGRAFEIVLRLYPSDYRSLFAGEMLNAIEKRGEEHRGQRRPAFLRFALTEWIGLRVGAGAEWRAKLTTDRSVRGRCLPDLRMMRPPGVPQELWFAGAAMDAGLHEQRIEDTQGKPVLVGHFAVGLAAKRVEPTISLGALVLAAMLADLLWCIFMIAGIEQVQFRPAMGAANYVHTSNVAMSHSLLMDVLWAGLLAAGYFSRRRYPSGAWVLFGAVVSHWLLDWISHRPDMPLAPGAHKYFGLGLWASVPATVIVEGGFWLLAVVLYARASHPKKRAGVYAYWIVVAVLTLAWYSNVTGPPPPDPHTAPFVSFTFFSLAVAWAYWIDRLRGASEPSTRSLV